MRVVLVGVAAFLAAGAASAQTGTAAAQVITGATTADIIGFFQSASLKATDVTAPKDLAGSDSFRTVEVSMGEGATFYVGLLGCENKTPSARCELVMPYVMFGSLNFPLGRINAFNYSGSALSTMMITDDGTIMMAAKFNLAGGATTTNLFTNIAVFVSDIESAVDAIQKGGSSGSTISYKPAAQIPAKGFRVAAPEGAKVNWIGKATKNVDPTTVEALRHLGAAAQK